MSLKSPSPRAPSTTSLISFRVSPGVTIPQMDSRWLDKYSMLSSIVVFASELTCDPALLFLIISTPTTSWVIDFHKGTTLRTRQIRDYTELTALVLNIIVPAPDQLGPTMPTAHPHVSPLPR